MIPDSCPWGSRPGPQHPNPSLQTQSLGVPRPLRESCPQRAECPPLGSEEPRVRDPNPPPSCHHPRPRPQRPPDPPLSCLFSTPGTQTVILHFQPLVWSPRLADRETDVREKRSWFTHSHTGDQGPSWAEPGPPPAGSITSTSGGGCPPQTQGLGPPGQCSPVPGASLASHPSPKGQRVLGPSPSSPFCRSPGSKKETGIQGLSPGASSASESLCDCEYHLSSPGPQFPHLCGRGLVFATGNFLPSYAGVVPCSLQRNSWSAWPGMQYSLILFLATLHSSQDPSFLTGD